MREALSKDPHSFHACQTAWVLCLAPPWPGRYTGPPEMEEFLRQLSISAVPILAAIVVHEVAHGYVAFRLGDPTAARQGRLTLNPLVHIDPVGTLLLPAVLLLLHAPLFGYARPVPVNPSKLRDPRRGMILVSAAGPAANMLLAVASALVLRILPAPHAIESGSPLVAIVLMVQVSVVVNIFLGLFNLLPIPPLDGGRLLTEALPYRPGRVLASLEPFGFLLIFVLLTTPFIDQVIAPIEHLLLAFLL